MSQLQNIILILLILNILFTFYIYCNCDTTIPDGFEESDYIENFDGSQINSEALQNIASIYNDRNASLTNLTVTNSFNMLPPGTIVMFNGSVAPAGWALCDGQAGRPDLRGRFVLGLGQGTDLTNRTLGSKDGAETHTLTVDEMPKHTHPITNVYAYYNNSTSPCRYMVGTKCQSGDGRPSSNTIHSGNDQPHNNMPPYYVLAFIIKL